MKWLRNVLLLMAGLVLAGLLLAAHYYYRGFYRPGRMHGLLVHSHPVDDGESGRIAEKAPGLKKFIAQRGFNQRIAFLVDMRLPSGRNRFFVYDLSKDSILQAGLVALVLQYLGQQLQRPWQVPGRQSLFGTFRTGLPVIWSRHDQ